MSAAAGGSPATSLSGLELLRSVARHSAAYGASIFLLRGANFLLIAIYTRYLTPADFGAVNLAEGVGAVFALVTGLGLDAALRRSYFQHDHSPDELRVHVSSVLRFAFLAAVSFLALGAAAVWLLDRWIHRTYGFPASFILLALVAATATQLLELRLGLYQTRREPKKYIAASTASFLFTALAVVLLVIVFRWEGYGMLLARAIAVSAIMLALWLASSAWLSGGFHRVHVREALSLGLPLVPHQFLALALVIADRFILAGYASVADVGIYSLAYTVGMAMYLATNALLQAYSPAFYDTARGDNGAELLGAMTARVIYLLVLVAAAGTLLARPALHLILDQAYHPAAGVVPWVIAGYLFHGIYSVLQLSIFQVRQTHLFWRMSALALAANLALNLLLVPRWGMYGAAWATTLAYALEAAVAYYYAQRVYPLRLPALRILLLLAVFAALVLSLGRA